MYLRSIIIFCTVGVGDVESFTSTSVKGRRPAMRHVLDHEDALRITKEVAFALFEEHRPGIVQQGEDPLNEAGAKGVAMVGMSLGLEEALRWLKLAYEHREIGIGYRKTSHAFKALLSD